MSNDRDLNLDRNLGAEGAIDRTKGIANKGLGEVEERTGGVLGDEEMEESGNERQDKGSMQKGMGKVKEKLDEALNG
ncbi:MAG TPA: hypothetical protein VIC85_13920 [Ktedonobacterales bacterium]|jgi:uncharacterized protein YjbJ (UPF0337 family)